MLLRHGRTAHNAGGVMQGQLDVPLDELGREQAALAAPLLAAMAPARVVTSDLSRARETAQAVADAAGQELLLDPRLRELHLGTWQGLTLQEARERYPEQHAAWVAGQDVSRGGGETYRQAGERAAACVTEHLAEVPDGGTLLAVTHGGTARAAAALLLDLAAVGAWRLAALGNCCWTVLVEGDRGWRLERHGVGVQETSPPRPGPDAEPVR